MTDLRDLHQQVDQAAAAAFGWDDIKLGHGFHQVRDQGVRFTISPSASAEILERLLELNKEKYEAEQLFVGVAPTEARSNRKIMRHRINNDAPSLFESHGD